MMMMIMMRKKNKKMVIMMMMMMRKMMMMMVMMMMMMIEKMTPLESTTSSQRVSRSFGLRIFEACKHYDKYVFLHFENHNRPMWPHVEWSLTVSDALVVDEDWQKDAKMRMGSSLGQSGLF